jgi:ABC-type branched-subunit amino acid transport system ATPase component
MTSPAPALSLRQISAGYQGANIVNDVTVDIAPGEIFTVIGPNGSGKSTLAKVVAGLIPTAAGEIWIGTSRLSGLSAPERVRAGLGYVPQEFNIFPNMTIGENLAVAVEFLGRSRGAMAKRREAVLAMFPEAGDRLRMRAGLLSGGERQLLAFACAMMSGPKLLLLDEPSAGLSPIMTAKIIDRITSINKTGVTIFMIEQNVTEALRISTRVMVLVAGAVRVLASPTEFGAKYDLHKVYLS